MPVLLHTSFKKTYPCKILPPPFFNLSDPPPLGEAIKIYFPPLQRGGENYVNHCLRTAPSQIFNRVQNTILI